MTALPMSARRSPSRFASTFSVAAYGRDLVPALGRRWVCLTALSVGIIAFGGRAPVEAGLVLQSGASTLQFSQGSSGSLDLAVSNTGTDATFVNNFWVGVQLVADPGATGTLSLASVSAPASNSLLTYSPTFDASAATLSGTTTVGGADYIQLIGANNSNSEDSLADGEVANLIAITFTASGDALGTWTLYGVNQSSSSVSYLSNVNDVQTGFDNVPATDDTYIALATITVTAVPEPRTDVLAGLAAAIGIAAASPLRHRRRRR
jgi:hypothetical protein